MKDGEIGSGALAEGPGTELRVGGRRSGGGGQGAKGTVRDRTDGRGEFQNDAVQCCDHHRSLRVRFTVINSNK